MTEKEALNYFEYRKNLICLSDKVQEAENIAISAIYEHLENKKTSVYTNADRIRTMKDGELYLFLSELNLGECECPAREDCEKFNSCENCFMDWLTKPTTEQKEK